MTVRTAEQRQCSRHNGLHFRAQEFRALVNSGRITDAATLGAYALLDIIRSD